MCSSPLWCLIRLYLTLKPRTTIYWSSYLIQFCSPDVFESGAPKLFFLTRIITLKICKKYWKYISLKAEMGNSNSGAGVNSGVGVFSLGVGVELPWPGVEFNWSWSWHFFPTPIQLRLISWIAKERPKKLHRYPSVNALEERKIKIYEEKENLNND
jgi:hypothetical protein